MNNPLQPYQIKRAYYLGASLEYLEFACCFACYLPEAEEQIELVEGLELEEGLGLAAVQYVPLELEEEVSQDGAVLLVSAPTVLHESFDSMLQLSTLDAFAHSCQTSCSELCYAEQTLLGHMSS